MQSLCATAYGVKAGTCEGNVPVLPQSESPAYPTSSLCAPSPAQQHSCSLGKHRELLTPGACLALQDKPGHALRGDRHLACQTWSCPLPGSNTMGRSLSEGWVSGKHLPHHSPSMLEASTDIILPAGTMTLYFQVITWLEGWHPLSQIGKFLQSALLEKDQEVSARG